MATQQEIKASIDKGLAWLVPLQSGNGSWAPDAYPVSNTGLAVLKLETYALENGFETPFDDGYIYKNNVIAGLNYIFSQAQSDVNGIYFQDGFSYVNYATGIVLAAISASSNPTRSVTSGSAPVIGKTYKQVADLIVQYLAYSQEDSGGWAYAKGFGSPDNSNSGYTVLGLEFAKSPTYKFECVIQQTLKDKLSSWIDYIQNSNGGSGYTDPDLWVNILKTGSLIQQMHLVGDDLTSTRLGEATTYIANNWNNAINWLGDNGGWINKNGSGNPTAVDYQATFTTMKGLDGYGIDIIKTTGNTDIDWFAQMADAIVKLQQGNGSWPATQPEDTILLCTEWALLTLEKAAPSPAQIPYKNNIVVDPYVAKCPWDLEQTIDIQGEIKIFAKKYKHSEAECSSNPKASKGDDIGFTFVFGNYGEFDYTAPKNQPTIEDTLAIQKPVNLKLMSLCLGDGYKLFYGNTATEVKVCDKFYGEIGNYILQVRKLVNGEYIADFDLPCHYICNISALFQIEFPSFPHCPDDNPPQ